MALDVCTTTIDFWRPPRGSAKLRTQLGRRPAAPLAMRGPALGVASIMGSDAQLVALAACRPVSAPGADGGAPDEEYVNGFLIWRVPLRPRRLTNGVPTLGLSLLW